MKAYSFDLRQKIVSAYEQGIGSQRAIAELFGVSRPFVEKLLHRYRMTGVLAADPHRGGKERCLTERDEEAIRQWVKEQADMTLQELCERLHTQRKKQVSIATMYRTLARLRLPLKKSLCTPPSKIVPRYAKLEKTTARTAGSGRKSA